MATGRAEVSVLLAFESVSPLLLLEGQLVDMAKAYVKAEKSSFGWHKTLGLLRYRALAHVHVFDLLDDVLFLFLASWQVVFLQCFFRSFVFLTACLHAF